MSPRKINQRDYTHYVIVSQHGSPKIESGWSYAEDAKEHVKGNLPGFKASVLSKTGAKRKGIDPDDNAHWLVLRSAGGIVSDKSAHMLADLVYSPGDNLDDADDTDLSRIVWAEFGVPESIQKYAAIEMDKRRMRREGRIGDAMYQEKRQQEIYDSLPNKLRW